MSFLGGLSNFAFGTNDWKKAWDDASHGHFGDALKDAAWGTLALGSTVAMALPVVGEGIKGAAMAAEAAHLATAGRAAAGIADVGRTAEMARATQAGANATRAVTAPARSSWLTDVAGATTRGSDATSTITRAADHTMYEIPDGAAVAGPRAASTSSRAMSNAAEVPFKASKPTGSVLTKTRPARTAPWDPYTSKPPFEVTPTPKTDAIPKLFEADPKVKTLPDYNPAHPMGEPVIPKPSAPVTPKPSTPLTEAPVPAESPSVAPTVAESVAEGPGSTVTGVAREVGATGVATEAATKLQPQVSRKTQFATAAATGAATYEATKNRGRVRRPATPSYVYVPGQDVKPQALF